MTQIATRRPSCPIPDECNSINACKLWTYPCGNPVYKSNRLFRTTYKVQYRPLDTDAAEGNYYAMKPIDMTFFGVNGEFDPEKMACVAVTLSASDNDDSIMATVRFFKHDEGADELYFSQARGKSTAQAVQNAVNRITEGDFAPDNFARKRALEQRLKRGGR